ncbi:MAG: porin [Pseudomonadota bacterium]
MKLKSLLLASGAAVVAVSGARAADAVIIPEPEPVEYVRVCDAAGTGYFYIPGTETCLQISGEVIYKMNFRNTPDVPVLDVFDEPIFDDDDSQNGWEKEYEISLDFNTWRDTEYGDLTTSIQLGASDSTIGVGTQDVLVDAGVAVNEAFITLGGLTIGYTDSFYPGGLGASDLDAEGPDTGIIGYTVDFGNGSFGIALEDDGNVDWVPAIAAVVAVEFGDVTVAAAGVYDDTDSFFGGQLHLVYSSGPLTVDASAQYSDPAAGGLSTGSAYSAGYEWVLGLGMDYDVNSQLTVFAGLDYGIDQLNGTGDDDLLVEVGADYELVDGFTIGFQADFSDRTTGSFDFEDAEITFTRSF